MTHRFDNAAEQRVPYNAYMVRLWQDTLNDGWRASVQSVQSGEVVRFGSLKALLAFLEATTHEPTTDSIDDNTDISHHQPAHCLHHKGISHD